MEKKRWVYQCKICKQYRTTDGDWIHLNSYEVAMLCIFTHMIEFHVTLCPECDTQYERRGV